MEKLEIGSIYSDPEGMWEITDIQGDDVHIKLVPGSDGGLNDGRESIVTREEAAYFLEHGLSEI